MLVFTRRPLGFGSVPGAFTFILVFMAIPPPAVMSVLPSPVFLNSDASFISKPHITIDRASLHLRLGFHGLPPLRSDVASCPVPFSLLNVFHVNSSCQLLHWSWFSWPCSFPEILQRLSI